MGTFILKPASAISADIGARIRHLRLRGNLTQQQLAEMAGTSFSSIRRLETSGQGTIELLVRTAQALQAIEPFEALFAAPPRSIAEVERLAQAPVRQRARPPGRAASRKASP